MRLSPNTSWKRFRLFSLCFAWIISLACGTAKRLHEGRIVFDIELPADFKVDSSTAKQIVADFRWVLDTTQQKDKLLREAYRSIFSGAYFKPSIWQSSPFPSEIVFDSEMLRLPKKEIYPPLDFYYYKRNVAEYVEYRSFLDLHYEITYTAPIANYQVKSYQPLREKHKIMGYPCKAYRCITESGNIDVLYTPRILSDFDLAGIKLPVSGTILGLRKQETIEMGETSRNIEIYIKAKEITPLPKFWTYPYQALRVTPEVYAFLSKGYSKEQLQPGEPMAEFSAPDCSGMVYSNVDLKTQPTILLMWDTLDPRLVEELQLCQKIAGEYAKHKVKILGLTTVGRNECENLAMGGVIHFPIVPNMRGYIQYAGIQDLPCLIFLNDKGEVVESFAIRKTSYESVLRASLTKYFQQ